MPRSGNSCNAVANHAPQAQIMRRNAALSRPAQPDISRAAQRQVMRRRRKSCGGTPLFLVRHSRTYRVKRERHISHTRKRIYRTRAAGASSLLRERISRSRSEHIKHVQRASRASSASISRMRSMHPEHAKHAYFSAGNPLSESPAASFIQRKASLFCRAF